MLVFMIGLGLVAIASLWLIKSRQHPTKKRRRRYYGSASSVLPYGADAGYGSTWGGYSGYSDCGSGGYSGGDCSGGYSGGDCGGGGF